MKRTVVINLIFRINIQICVQYCCHREQFPFFLPIHFEEVVPRAPFRQCRREMEGSSDQAGELDLWAVYFPIFISLKKKKTHKTPTKPTKIHFQHHSVCSSGWMQGVRVRKRGDGDGYGQWTSVKENHSWWGWVVLPLNWCSRAKGFMMQHRL